MQLEEYTLLAMCSVSVAARAGGFGGIWADGRSGMKVEGR